jgi:TolB-like protein
MRRGCEAESARSSAAMNSGAIFLSYASQDAAVAQRICDALRAAGLEVWFDQNELRGGDAWDAKIRSQIKDCALFVPLISANTDARSEGYFRREWNLAVDRMLDIAEERAFLLPVVIDDTADATAKVPQRFRERQWTRLHGGDPTPDFVARVGRLLAGEPAAPPVPRRAATAPTAVRERNRALPLVIGALVAIIGVAGWLWKSKTDSGTPIPTIAPAKVDAAPAARKSIAVLPFTNLSGKADDAYLADGLHEEVLNALARLRDLKVISRTSVAEFKDKAHNVREIGQRLGVGTVLEGSVRREGNTLRLTVQLIDTHTDQHFLAANYDRDMSRLLELQSAVARQLADALSATLTRVDKGDLDRVATNSGDAYDRYLRAVALYRRPTPKDETGLTEPRRLLAEALQFDPEFADAQALLSMANTWRFFQDTHSKEDGAAAQQALDRAFAIDPKLPEARLARGLHAMYVSRNLDQALDDLTAVVQLRPNSGEAHSTLGFALRRKGRNDEALVHLLRAGELDPLNETYSTGPTLSYLGLRRFPEAIEHTRVLSRRFPNNPDHDFVRARLESFMQRSAEPLKAALRDHEGRIDAPYHKAIEAEIARLEGRYLDAVRLWDGVPAGDPVDRSERIGFLYLAAGDKVRAEQTFRALERRVVEGRKRDARFGHADALRQLAIAKSMLGKHAEALQNSEAACAMAPETSDATNGPRMSFTRSVILVRAGRAEEGYAEVKRLLRVPFGAPFPYPFEQDGVLLWLENDPQYDELIHRPPRL